MSILEMIEEWEKGCSIAGPVSANFNPSVEGPEHCPECTAALIEAIKRKILKEKDASGS